SCSSLGGTSSIGDCTVQLIVYHTIRQAQLEARNSIANRVGQRGVPLDLCPLQCLLGTFLGFNKTASLGIRRSKNAQNKRAIFTPRAFRFCPFGQEDSLWSIPERWVGSCR